MSSKMLDTKANQDSDLARSAATGLQQAYAFAKASVQPGGHWCGELKSNVTVTAEYVFLRQTLGHWQPGHNQRDREAISRYLLSEQNEDGSWSIAPGLSGNISTSTEAYLALKILGQSCKACEAMCKAQRWIPTIGGGVESVRVFTRVQLATFGLLPWSAVPQLPAELILMPAFVLINIYTLSSWARSTLIPLLVVCHHQPVYKLPNGTSANNDFLDELWCQPKLENLPYHRGFLDMLACGDWIGCLFTAIDMIFSFLGGMRKYNPFRRLAIARCMTWITTHQEPSGDWAGIFPPMHVGVLAYLLEGYDEHDGPVRRALEAIERFAWHDERGKRMQACVSPVWDTILMSVALVDIESDVQGLSKHTADERQILENRGDWRIYRPTLIPGGFSFEYHNVWYPDVDDTAAAVIAFLKDDPHSAASAHVLDAVKWILGMQCADDGWAAFDVDNDKLFLNRIPFSDMESLCDPSSPDIVGRVLEAFGLFLLALEQTGLQSSPPLRMLSRKIREASDRGIDFLARTQEPNGAWQGRWGINYIYGTSNAICGVAHFCYPDSDSNGYGLEDSINAKSSSRVCSMVRQAVLFLVSTQNVDGGWGESLETYRYPEISKATRADFDRLFSVTSTATQTAWALNALLACLATTHPAITAGIRYLIDHQTQTGLHPANRTRSVGGYLDAAALEATTETEKASKSKYDLPSHATLDT